jgi:hypothetical protein
MGAWCVWGRRVSIATADTENVEPYVDQLDMLQGTGVLHSIAWRTDPKTKHVCEAQIQWSPADRHLDTVRGGASASAQLSGLLHAEGAAASLGMATGTVVVAAAAPLAGGGCGLLLTDNSSTTSASATPAGAEESGEGGRLQRRFENRLKTLEVCIADGHDTAQLEAEIAEMRAELATRSPDPRASLSSSRAQLELSMVSEIRRPAFLAGCVSQLS